MDKAKYYQSLEKKNVKIVAVNGQIWYAHVMDVTAPHYDDNDSDEWIFDFWDFRNETLKQNEGWVLVKEHQIKSIEPI